MSELVLERARITNEVIDVMLREDQKNAIVGLISRRPRPKWIEGEEDGVVERDIQFNDIVKAALECKEGSQAVIQLIKRMKNEVHS
jgi:transposase